MLATNDNLIELKKRVGQAFASLRRQGYVAKRGFMCCQSCACAEAASIVEKMPNTERSKLQGFVYYHKQDQDRIKLRQRKPWTTAYEFGGLNIRFGEVYVGDDVYGKQAYKIGQDVAVALARAGLQVEWDMDPDRTINVVGLL